MQQTMDQVLAVADAAIRLPRSALQIYDLAQNPEVKKRDLVAAIETDPAFASRLLRMANSPIYSGRIEVTNLNQAILTVGNREIAQLALVLATSSEFSKLETELLHLTSFWSHSLTTAVLARKIVKKVGGMSGDVFCAALLHDLGQLVLFHTCTSQMTDVLEQSLDDENSDLASVEQRILGFDHTRVGEKLAINWGLPDVIVATIRYHHDPMLTDRHHQTVAAVAYANSLEANGLSMAGSLPDLSVPFLTQVETMLGPDYESYASLLEESQEEANGLLSFFC
ncbi:MAG: HDOD domain-containing protein [Gammaproteobacteria bacterium]